MKFNRDEVVQKLEAAGAQLPCHRCGQRSFSVLEQITNFSIQEELQGLRLGGHSVPAALVICNNCGAMTPHALGALDLLVKPEGES